jgi:hypothetical protein
MPGKTAAQNDEVFDKVADHLTLGGNILIFPEGTSHNEPHLLGLRTGAGRMLARARQRAPAAHLTYQAVALEFEDRTTFRSRALVVYGPVRTVEAAAEEPEAVALRITEQVKLDLSELLVEATTWDERVAIVRVAEMFVNAEGSDSLARWNEIGRRVEAARRALSDPAYQAIARAVNAYHARLGAAGLSDLQLARSGPALGPWRVARAVALVSTLPLALVGAVLFAVPYQLPRLAVRFSGGTPDVHSTYKLATGILAYPIFAGIYIFGAATVLNAPLALVAALVVLVSPLLALAWLDRSAHLGGALRALLRPAQASELRAERARLLAMLEETQTRLSG